MQDLGLWDIETDWYVTARSCNNAASLTFASPDDIYNNASFTAMQGSIFWMAPEMLHNDNQGYNAKIDIWSLGCVVLEMWAGTRPWNQEDALAVIFKLGKSRLAPPVPPGVILSPIADDFRKKCFAT
jgi:serine/threonine protein kinase